MDAQPAVARSVGREFLRKEKRRELPRRLSGVRSDPDLVRLGVLRSAREKRERAFVAVAHLDREIFGKFSFGTRQTDFQTVHPVCKRQFDAIRHRRQVDFPVRPKHVRLRVALAALVGRDRMDVPVLLRTDVLAGRIVGRNFAVAQVALFQFRPPRAVLTCKNEMLRGRAEYIETDPVTVFERPASVLADRGPRGGQIEHEFHLSVGDGAETLGRRIALAASGHKKSRPPKEQDDLS